MHDDGRYDDPRVTGSAGDPVSRETEFPGWRPSEGGAQSPPVARGEASVPDAPWPRGGEVNPGAPDSAARPGNASPEARVIPIRRNSSASARFEAAPPHQPVPDPRPASDTPAGPYEPATPEAAYVSRETPTREEDDPPLAMEAMRAVQILNPSGEVTMPRPERTRVMCVANQKGGVGKTTTTVNLAVALALHGNRVLVVDLDPQGNASTGLNVPHHTGVPDVYDCLINSVPLEEVAQAVEGIPNLWCVPATIDLAGAEIELVSVVARESRLARAIAAYPGHFDYVFIDCPPSLGLLTVNALVAAQEVLIPIQCEYYALEGLNQLINNINLVRQHLNPRLEVSTILLTMYDRRTRLADAVEQDVRNHFGDKVLQAVIPRNVRVSEAPSYGQSVMTYDPGSRGATSYFEAAQEIAERGVKEPVSRNA
ncbi:ParA family protein [Micromonospora gifhornensis]|uniref:ParA family protein n=1 Tax=Micromonospora gifhornensis TaxID=84594 RepID=UPI0023B312A3|nr:AAA family ATPase [Micromonospora gifhornensis]